MHCMYMNTDVVTSRASQNALSPNAVSIFANHINHIFFYPCMHQNQLNDTKHCNYKHALYGSTRD